jgi:hypothetical protein
MVSQTPLRAKVMARDFSDFDFIKYRFYYLNLIVSPGSAMGIVNFKNFLYFTSGRAEKKGKHLTVSLSFSFQFSKIV